MPAPIAVQLYSLRAEAETDFLGVLERVGSIGYRGVELAGLHGHSPAAVRSVLDQCGLQVASGHIGDATPEALRPALDDLQTLGCDRAVLAYLPPAAFADVDAISRSAELINSANEIARERGMSFGYHNHFWEFNTLIEETTAWNWLFAQLDSTVMAELDIYWATVGGADPIQVLDDLGSRAQLIHVKDGPADEPQNAMVAVGSGSLDITAILTAATSAAWHIVELDRCDTDMFAAVEDSFRFLVSNGLSAGRE
jgi:sugar phosphate isomerase/epimerase